MPFLHFAEGFFCHNGEGEGLSRYTQLDQVIISYIREG